MRFAKYQGIGNDFLVVDLRDAPADIVAAAQNPAAVRALCDRRFGVGGDGVLAILPSTTAVARMRVLNADGSEAEMCGNGIRCVASELHDRLGETSNELAIETAAGRLVCELDPGGVTVAMGAPRLTRAEIPMTGPADERCVGQVIEVAGHANRAITCVSMGNPHAIAFVDSLAEAQQLAASAGPLVERHPWFPQRTNAEFAHVRDRRHIELVVWERGCGLTLACGTGACATAVAAILNGSCDEDLPIEVALPGGTLTIRVAPGMTEVAMRGPAVRVYDGDIDVVALAQL